MSNKYPCIYYDNGKCQKFSDEKYNSWCDFDQCEHQTPSNGDRIRGMSDEELVDVLRSERFCPRSPSAFGCGPGTCEECWLDWLKRPAEEDT